MSELGTYLVVTCEKCGKTYGTSPEKLKKKKVTFPCKQCGETVTAIRPDAVEESKRDKNNQSAIPDAEGRKTKESTFKAGLTAKFLLFTILPLILVSMAVVYIADNRMRSLQRLTISSSTEVVKNVSEDLILQIAETVSRQTRQYLFSHPDLRKENFNRDIYFKKVVLQKIGITGSTALYEIGGENGAWTTWADVDPLYVGRDMRKMEQTFGAGFQQFWKIVTGVKSGGISSGVFKLQDSKGDLRDRFMVCTLVEGTPYAIMASIFVDEITAPLQKIETQGELVAKQIRLTLVSILGGGLLLIFFILFFYGRSITTKIKRLADWADAISLGELDSKPAHRDSNDEIGELTEAITRMQESIKLSLARLQKRRKN